MSSAGQQLVAGRIPSERIATTVETVNSPTFTSTEVVLMTVAAPVVAGRIYKVRVEASFVTTVDNDRVSVAIREDGLAGNQLQAAQIVISTSTVNGETFNKEVEFTASSTADKTLVMTGVRAAGTGDIQMRALSNRPAYLYVDYIRG